MSTLTRTIRNIMRVGLKDYGHQMQYIGDTKAGTLVGTDRFGNKYYENFAEELPLRTRWVDYKSPEYEASNVEPGWHAWISYLAEAPPTQDKLLQVGVRPWESQKPLPNWTQSRGAYKPYSTTKAKVSPWEPVAKSRN